MGSRSISYTMQKDLRADLAGASVGQVAAPGSTLVNPGSIGIGATDYAQVHLVVDKFRAGLSGADVKGLLAQQAGLADTAIGRVTDFASASLAAATAARTGELPTWQKYIPLVIGAIALVAIWRRSH